MTSGGSSSKQLKLFEDKTNDDNVGEAGELVKMREDSLLPCSGSSIILIRIRSSGYCSDCSQLSVRVHIVESTPQT